MNAHECPMNAHECPMNASTAMTTLQYLRKWFRISYVRCESDQIRVVVYGCELADYNVDS